MDISSVLNLGREDKGVGMAIGDSGERTYSIYARDADAITKALTVEDGYRLATRYSEQLTPELAAEIERPLGDPVADRDGLRDEIFEALRGVLVNVRVRSPRGTG